MLVPGSLAVRQAGAGLLIGRQREVEEVAREIYPAMALCSATCLCKN
jgi:hypothetical protein